MNGPVPLQQVVRERRAIRVRGLVQGVGFRPHVYRCATRLGLAGFVSNGPEGVVIEVEGAGLDEFLRLLYDGLPSLARIDNLIETPLAPVGETGFHIAPTLAGAANGAAIPADTALCDDCLRELFDPQDRRYLHPFIACCNCGPRYTMTRTLPYDRVNTTMAEFSLCPACTSEYRDPLDRRFHAEPVACHDCGPRLSSGVDEIARAISAGEIVAIKGVGGYHLVCDAGNRETVRRLRRGKRRDGRPFAVMLLNGASARCYLDADEYLLAELAGPERPVVIAGQIAGAALSPDISRGLGTLGVMLPYTGLHYLLFHALLGRPTGHAWLEQGSELALVMTSGNVSGEPLITEAAEAERRLAGIADRFLHHDRTIAARADDSVVRVAGGARTVVRRGRGFTPHAVKLATRGPQVLALGPHLKTTVAMTRGNRAYISPHVGDLESAAAVSFHAATATAMEAMLQTRAEIIACDLSPDFASSRLAEQLSAERGLPLVRVQHHHAHIGAVLAEHRVEQPVLGLALDGHGQGLDGASWGGELLRVDGACCERLGHLAPLPLPGGDLAAREPWRMAAGALYRMGRAEQIGARFAAQPLAGELARWLAAGEVPETTAAGRLFDAAAGLLGVSVTAGFEGEPPMLLEALARDTQVSSAGYRLREGELDFTALLAELADCGDPARGAALFHGTLVEGLVAWVLDAARRSGLERIALGGGCFINAQLARVLPERLRAAGLEVLQARAMPPNDGAVSLGQAWVAQRSR